MNVHIGYKVRKTPDIEKEVHQQVEKLRKRLQVFRPELVHLKGLIEENSPREGVVVSLNLRLPSGQMAAQRKAPSPASAVKAAFDDCSSKLPVTRTCCARRTSFRAGGRGKNSVPDDRCRLRTRSRPCMPPVVSGDDIRTYVNVESRPAGAFRRARALLPRNLRTDRKRYHQRPRKSWTKPSSALSATAARSPNVWRSSPGSTALPCAPSTRWPPAPTSITATCIWRNPRASATSAPATSRTAIPSARRGHSRRGRYRRPPRFHSRTNRILR